MNLKLYRIDTRRDAKKVAYEYFRNVWRIDPSIYDKVFDGERDVNLNDDKIAKFRQKKLKKEV